MKSDSQSVKQRHKPALAGLCLVLATLEGCASVDNMTREHARTHTPLKVLLVQAPMSVSPKRLQKVFAPKSKKSLSFADPVLSKALIHSQTQARADMQTTLGKRAYLDVIQPPAKARSVIERIEKQRFSTALTQDEATHIHADTGADAILRFGITDYGLTPRSWRTAYITFEVVTTLAITALIASAGTDLAKGTAGTYLAQEVVEETVEGYAGFWALDVVCRPVRIEAELIQLNPMQIVWKDNNTGLSDISLSRLTRKVETHERDRQLDQATAFAVNDLVTDMAFSLGFQKPVHKLHSFANGR